MSNWLVEDHGEAVVYLPPHGTVNDLYLTIAKGKIIGGKVWRDFPIRVSRPEERKRVPHNIGQSAYLFKISSTVDYAWRREHYRDGRAPIYPMREHCQSPTVLGETQCQICQSVFSA